MADLPCIPEEFCFRSKDDFVDALKRCLSNCDRDTVGMIRSRGDLKWAWVEFADERFHLNADTRREGMEAFIANDAAGQRLWYVVENERGRWNKVTNRSDKNPIENFFFYAANPG